MTISAIFPDGERGAGHETGRQRLLPKFGRLARAAPRASPPPASPSPLPAGEPLSAPARTVPFRVRLSKPVTDTSFRTRRHASRSPSIAPSHYVTAAAEGRGSVVPGQVQHLERMAMTGDALVKLPPQQLQHVLAPRRRTRISAGKAPDTAELSPEVTCLRLHDLLIRPPAWSVKFGETLAIGVCEINGKLMVPSVDVRHCAV